MMRVWPCELPWSASSYIYSLGSLLGMPTAHEDTDRHTLLYVEDVLVISIRRDKECSGAVTV